MNKFYLTFIMLFFSVFVFNSKASESYIEYENRINSIRHKLKKGESVSKVLIEKGYTELFGKSGSIQYTLFKNGIRKNDVKKLPIGKEIILPYTEKKEKIKTRTIASVPTIEKVAKRNRLTHVSLLPTLSALQIISVDSTSGAKGTIISTLNYGLNFNWLNDWGVNSGLQTFLYASLQRYKLEVPSTTTIVNSTVERYQFGAGLYYRFSKKNKIGLSFGLDQTLFLALTSDLSTKADKLALQNIATRGQHQLAEFQNLKMLFSWKIGTYMPESNGDGYSFKSGYIYDASLGAHYKLNDTSYIGTIGTSKKSLTTTTATQENSEPYLSIGLQIDF